MTTMKHLIVALCFVVLASTASRADVNNFPGSFDSADSGNNLIGPAGGDITMRAYSLCFQTSSEFCLLSDLAGGLKMQSVGVDVLEIDSSGNMAIAGDVTLTGGAAITTTANADATFSAGSGTLHNLSCSCDGDGTCSGIASCTQGDREVEGRLKVGTTSEFTGIAAFNNQVVLVGEKLLYFGSSSTGTQPWISSDLTAGAWLFHTGSAYGRQMVIHDRGAQGLLQGFDHADNGSPAVYFQGPVDPNDDNTQWGVAYHDGTSGSTTSNLTFKTGAGGIVLDPASYSVDIDGVVATRIDTVTADGTTLDWSAGFIKADATGGNRTINLPDAATCKGNGPDVLIKRIDNTGNTLTISSVSNIDTSASDQTIGVLASKWYKCDPGTDEYWSH